MMPALAVSYADVAAAADRLLGVAQRTPVVTSRTLDERTGARVFLKCENLQRMGAFKFRGAYNRLAQLSQAERRAGVVAFSSGNHAQGVALAAQLLGVPATIVMPDSAPAAKSAATREYGARVVGYDPHSEQREAIAASIAAQSGAAIVPPFNDPDIIAGQGTVAKELLEDIPDLDVLLVCVGGGGLLSGCALAAAALQPRAQVWGVEPELADDFARSFAAGERLEIPLPQTIADGLRTTSPGTLTFPIVQRLVRGFVTVSEDDLLGAMRFGFERLKLVFEPSGATALAALLSGKFAARGKRVGVVISGGNADPEIFARALCA